MPAKKPAPPRDDAPKADHKKHAQEVLDDPKYKQKPANFQDRNDEAKP